MSEITIPPEALRAARVASMNARGDGEDPIEAACIAMLKAWPGVTWNTIQVPDNSDEVRYTLKKVGIILPLTENTNAEG